MNQEPNSESLTATITQLKQLNEQLQLQVAAYQRAEQEVRFLHSIAQAIDESPDFHSALAIALEKICQFTGWQFGEAWIPDPQAQILTYSSSWYGAQNLEQFRRSSEVYRFTSNAGLPGRVWASKRPEWIHISDEPETVFLRKTLAAQVGFKTGLSVPIVDSSDRVLAVLVFFMFTSDEIDAHLIETMSTVAIQLSGLIQRQQTETALHQSNTILQSILDSSPDFIYVKDLQGCYVTLNQATAEWFGTTIEEIVGKDDTQLFSSETAQEIAQVDRTVMLTGKPSVTEDIVPRQGTLWTMLATKSPWRDVQGNIIGVVCVCRDISDRVLTTAALQESERQYATLAKVAPVGIFHTDAKGQCLYVNERWCEMTGLSATEALGTGWMQAIHPDDLDWIVAKWNQVKQQQDLMFCSEYRCLRPDGVVTWVFGQATAEKNADGETVSYVGTITDISDRILATTALRESETLYSTIFAQTIEGIFFIDLETKRILDTNHAFANFLGYTPSQLIELSLYDVVALDPQIIDNNTQRSLKEKICSLGETPYRRSDGSIIYAEVNVSTILYSGQEVACIITHDVTDRKRVEEALRQSQAWLQAILDNSTALIYIKDLDGKYLLVNVWFSLLFYSNRREIKGKTDSDIFPPEIATTLRLNDQKVLAAKSPMDWEELLPHEDDGWHTYLSIKFPLYNENGEPYAICGISTDITERKRAEDALRSSMATNRALLNAIPDLMFRINRAGTFVNFKAAKGDRLHLPAHEFLGKHLSEVFPSEIAQEISSCIKRALFNGEVQILECQLIVNNEFREYELRIAVSAENEVMAIVRDITDRKRTEAEIRLALEKEKELGELKSRFVTMASHEFRTPLATILSSSELLEHYSHKWSEDRKLNHLQRIQTSVKHMTQLLNDVLLIGKAEAGKLEFSPTSIDLEQFCREIVEDIQLTASDRQIIFHSEATKGVFGMMDEKLLRHIFINLLSNAIKYSPSDRSVNFDLIGKNETAIFRVQDRGIGIPLAEQEEIFSSFHRASNVGTISGTGLGLAIVKKSIDLHGGKISVESSVGLGTVFTVVLPLNRQAT